MLTTALFTKNNQTHIHIHCFLTSMTGHYRTSSFCINFNFCQVKKKELYPSIWIRWQREGRKCFNRAQYTIVKHYHGLQTPYTVHGTRNYYTSFKICLVCNACALCVDVECFKCSMFQIMPQISDFSLHLIWSLCPVQCTIVSF